MFTTANCCCAYLCPLMQAALKVLLACPALERVKVCSRVFLPFVSSVSLQCTTGTSLAVLPLHSFLTHPAHPLTAALCDALQIQSIQGLGSPVVTPQGCRLSCLEVEVLDVRSAAHLDPSLLGLISSPFTLQVGERGQSKTTGGSLRTSWRAAASDGRAFCAAEIHAPLAVSAAWLVFSLLPPDGLNCLQVSASDIPPAAVDRVGGGADGGREERAVRGSDLGLVRAAVTRLCQLPQVAHLCKVHVQPPVAVNRCANAAASSTEAHLCELLRALGPLSSVGVTSQS
jgi:hypothetical protein